MSLLKRKIEHPQVAILVIIVISAVLAKYGIVEGAALLFALFSGVVIYKLVTA